MYIIQNTSNLWIEGNLSYLLNYKKHLCAKVHGQYNLDVLTPYVAAVKKWFHYQVIISGQNLENWSENKCS